jgi:hypothetical protein
MFGLEDYCEETVRQLLVPFTRTFIKIEQAFVERVEGTSISWANTKGEHYASTPRCTKKGSRIKRNPTLTLMNRVKIVIEALGSMEKLEFWEGNGCQIPQNGPAPNIEQEESEDCLDA